MKVKEKYNTKESEHSSKTSAQKINLISSSVIGIDRLNDLSGLVVLLLSLSGVKHFVCMQADDKVTKKDIGLVYRSVDSEFTKKESIINIAKSFGANIKISSKTDILPDVFFSSGIKKDEENTIGFAIPKIRITSEKDFFVVGNGKNESEEEVDCKDMSLSHCMMVASIVEKQITYFINTGFTKFAPLIRFPKELIS
jgi:hypothetical protein